MRILLILVVLCFISCSKEQKPEFVDFNYDEFYSYLSALSHDSTMGRAPGSSGYDRSAAYCVRLLEKWGLEPAGEDNTWYRQIRFTEGTKDESSLTGFVTAGRKKIQLDPVNNFVARPLVQKEKTDIKDVPIVFAGFGIEAPELGYNSYDGLDVKGKIVLLSHGAPSAFNPEASAIYGSASQKGNTALAHGARGVITFLSPFLNLPISFIRTNAFYAMGWSHSSGEYSDNNPNLEINARISEELAGEILATTGWEVHKVVDSLKSGASLSTPLSAKLTAGMQYHQRTFDSPNIVALLPGQDPQLKNEVVVMTAHLDHIGTRPSNGQDSIYNGTLDNASGSAALLTLAHRLSQEKSNARSILFVWVNAEELGLLGSDYFARYPTVPRSRIVANLNIDGMGGLMVQTTDYIAYGYPYSNLAASVDKALAGTGSTLAVDKRPEQAFFVRSDQYSFVKQGIPAIFLANGDVAADSTLDAVKIGEAWEQERYHKPNDDLSQPLDKDGLLRDLKVEYLLAQEVVNRKEPIRWKEGSFLWERFVKKFTKM